MQVLPESIPNVDELDFLLNEISHAILFETVENEILFINRQFCELFHIPVPPAELIGTNCAAAAKESAILFNDPAGFIKGIHKAYSSKKEIVNEELQFADGRSIYRDYKPVLNHPLFKGHLWIYKNTHEIKSILSEVAEQKNFYEHLLQHIPADIAILDKDHRYLFLNKIAVSTNETRNWMIGKDDFDFCKHTGRPDTLAISRRNYFNEALASGETVEFEEINLTKTGEKVFNLRRFYPLKNSEGNIEKVIGYGINITRIREREEILLSREQAMRNMVDAMDQLVVSIDENRFIVYTNPQWSQVTGNSAAESIHKKICSFISTHKSQFVDNVNSFISQGRYKNPSRQVCMNDGYGKKYTLTYYISEFSIYQPGTRRFGIFFTDITAQLHAENELKKMARQEKKLNALKSNFMSLVSHELRTPLSVILSSVELLELKSNLGNIGDTTIYATRIIDQVDKMTRLMNDFLLVSKVESGNIQHNPMLFNIETLVNSLAGEIFSPWKDERRLAVSVKGDPKDVFADTSAITHILTNIITNAFKYSPGCPSPALRVHFTRRSWNILVIDSGIGIRQEDKKNLFQPFVRGSNVGEIEGTGLGLMVVKFFVRKNRGKMFIRSAQGKGTAILLEFPY